MWGGWGSNPRPADDEKYGPLHRMHHLHGHHGAVPPMTLIALVAPMARSTNRSTTAAPDPLVLLLYVTSPAAPSLHPHGRGHGASGAGAAKVPGHRPCCCGASAEVIQPPRQAIESRAQPGEPNVSNITRRIEFRGSARADPRGRGCREGNARTGRRQDYYHRRIGRSATYAPIWNPHGNGLPSASAAVSLGRQAWRAWR